MPMPNDIKIIDCMLGIPHAEDRGDWFDSFRPLLKDAQSRDQFAMPAQYMFKDIPETGKVDDFVKWTVDQMDRFNIEKALVGWNDNDTSRRAKERYPDRFFFDLPCNPNNGVDEVRRIKRIHQEVGLSAISVFPSGTLPQVAINHKYMFPLYTCAAGSACRSCSTRVSPARAFRWRRRRSSISTRCAGSSRTSRW